MAHGPYSSWLPCIYFFFILARWLVLDCGCSQALPRLSFLIKLLQTKKIKNKKSQRPRWAGPMVWVASLVPHFWLCLALIPFLTTQGNPKPHFVSYFERTSQCYTWSTLEFIMKGKSFFSSSGESLHKSRVSQKIQEWLQLEVIVKQVISYVSSYQLHTKTIQVYSILILGPNIRQISTKLLSN